MRKHFVVLTALVTALLVFTFVAQAEEIAVPCTYCGAEITADSEAVTFTAAPEPETLSVLLPDTKITNITLACEVGPEEISALQKACPDTAFHWTLDLCGQTVTPETEELYYNDIPLENTEPFYAVLPLLPRLHKLEMCGCGIGNEEMDALRTAFPEKGIVWSIITEYWTVRTDATYFATWIIISTNAEGMVTDARGVHENTNATLDWLGYCHDLVALDISHNKVENIEFVRNMPHLQYLIIVDNKVQDLSPLEGLSELYYLEIFANPVTDLTPLAGLTELKHLNLCGCRVKDLTPLDGLELDRVFVSEDYMTKREAWQAREHYLSLHPFCYFVVTEHGDYTGYGWRKTAVYREMRHRFNHAA